MSNNPPILIELDPELAEFLLDNCTTNISFALVNLQNVSRPTAEKLVDNIEKFKALKAAVERGKKPL